MGGPCPGGPTNFARRYREKGMAESAPAAAMVSKAEVWMQVHRQKVPCPQCAKVVTRRTLRWKHKCRRAVVVLSDTQAEERRQQLEHQVLRDLLKRIGTQE